MKIDPRLKSLDNAFFKGGFKLYLVGGTIRDNLLRLEPKEWDLSTDATPPDIKKILNRIQAKDIATVGEQFGTIAAKLDGKLVEITTFRGEVYREDSRKPEVTFSQTIDEDLSRRDFTINAIAYDLHTDKLIDPFGGEDDLDDKIVRSVGDPDKRFDEDPLRMLRAIRFASLLDFEIEPKTLASITSNLDRFKIISSERIAAEMDKLLLGKQPSRGVRLLVQTGLIDYIVPELREMIHLEFDPREHKDVFEHTLQVLDNTPAKLSLRWAALLHDIAKPKTRQKIAGEYHFHSHEVVGSGVGKSILRRLKYPNDFVKEVGYLVFLHQRIPLYDGTWEDGGVRRFVRDAGELLDDLFEFAKADLTSKNPRKIDQYTKSREALRERIDQLKAQEEIAKIKSPLSGEELMQMFDRAPGPWIKPIKDHLLNLVLDGKLKQTDKAEAEAIARELLDTKSV